jgi:hypothetical protein
MSLDRSDEISPHHTSVPFHSRISPGPNAERAVMVTIFDVLAFLTLSFLIWCLLIRRCLRVINLKWFYSLDATDTHSLAIIGTLIIYSLLPLFGWPSYTPRHGATSHPSLNEASPGITTRHIFIALFISRLSDIFSLSLLFLIPHLAFDWFCWEMIGGPLFIIFHLLFIFTILLNNGFDLRRIHGCAIHENAITLLRYFRYDD